jgi:hypothetical protein
LFGSENIAVSIIIPSASSGISSLVEKLAENQVKSPMDSWRQSEPSFTEVRPLDKIVNPQANLEVERNYEVMEVSS